MKRGPARSARVAAAAALVGAVLLGPLGFNGAGAATKTYEANAGGFALRVIVDVSNLAGALPAEAQGALAGVLGDDFTIDQRFIVTSSDADDDSTVAVSKLGDGFLDLPSVTATAIGQDVKESVLAQALPDDALPLLNTGVGVLQAKVLAGPALAGDATLANVSAGLGPVVSQLPADVQDALDEVFATLNALVEDVVGELAGVVAGDAIDLVTEEVCEAETPVIPGLPLPGDLTDQVCEVVAEVDEELQQLMLEELISDLTDQLLALLDLPEIENPLAGTLAQVTDLVTNTSAARGAGNKSVAAAASQVKAVDILDGLVSADLISIASQSEAAGSPGSAKASGSCSIADVQVGDFQVSFDSVSGLLDGVGIPAELTGLVDDLTGTLQGVLDLAGVTATLCDEEASDEAADGRSASHLVSAFRVEVAPTVPDGLPAEVLGVLQTAGIDTTQPLFRVVVDPSVETSVLAQPQVTATPTSPPTPRGDEGQLPHTGAPFAVSVLVGSGLVAAAYALRRRIG